MRNMKRCIVLLVVAALLATSCASTYTLSWKDGTYDNDRKEKDYWCAVGTGIDELHALGDACTVLETEITKLLGRGEDIPWVEVQVASGESGVIFSQDTGDAVFYAAVYNSEAARDGRIIRIGFKRADMEKALKRIYDGLHDDATSALKRYKSAGRYTFDRVVALQEAESLSKLADRSAKLLKLFTGKDHDSITAKILQTKQDLIADLYVRIDATDVNAPFKDRMVQAYASELRLLGFNVTEDHEDLTLKLSYDQQLSPKTKAPYAYVNYVMSYAVVFDGRTILSLVNNDRIAALTDEEALSKAERHAVMEAPKEFSTAFKEL
ncbi:MAG: hypothetical protein SPD11_10205 [Sphaerochaetaceae bacterium]|nr:hypothetical protein [Sphaerochaetaceae bacterium]